MDSFLQNNYLGVKKLSPEEHALVKAADAGSLFGRFTTYIEEAQRKKDQEREDALVLPYADALLEHIKSKVGIDSVAALNAFKKGEAYEVFSYSHISYNQTSADKRRREAQMSWEERVAAEGLCVDKPAATYLGVRTWVEDEWPDTPDDIWTMYFAAHPQPEAACCSHMFPIKAHRIFKSQTLLSRIALVFGANFTAQRVFKAEKSVEGHFGYTHYKVSVRVSFVGADKMNLAKAEQIVHAAKSTVGREVFKMGGQHWLQIDRLEVDPVAKPALPAPAAPEAPLPPHRDRWVYNPEEEQDYAECAAHFVLPDGSHEGCGCEADAAAEW
jgi:hypothetical protein